MRSKIIGKALAQFGRLLSSALSIAVGVVLVSMITAWQWSKKVRGEKMKLTKIWGEYLPKRKQKINSGKQETENKKYKRAKTVLEIFIILCFIIAYSIMKQGVVPGLAGLIAIFKAVQKDTIVSAILDTILGKKKEEE